jgi:hypothetical protein
LSVRTYSAWLLAVGAALALLLHRRHLGLVICAGGLLLLIAGRLYPPLSRAVENMGRKASSLAASAIGWIVLAPFYLFVFSAGHAMLALGGRDPLRLRFPSDESTDWLPVSTGQGSEDHRRPY